MKKIIIYISIVCALVRSTESQQAKAQVGVSVSFQSFYDNLSPYGSWISYPQYGYVWIPNAGRGFHPYRTSGHWVWSDEYEWIWVSDYEWGWAPFHYGRWHYDPFYGWFWIPDYQWAPAWVIWRSGGDYYGWAPLDAGVFISTSYINYSPPYDYWCFVPRQYIYSPTIYNYYVSPQQNSTIVSNTTVIKTYSTSGGPAKNVFVSGPQRTEVEKYTGQTIAPVKLSETTKPGRTRTTNKELMIYKPKVNSGDKRMAKPSKLAELEKMEKPQPEKNQPVRNEREKTQPQKEQPVRNAPERAQPQKEQPVRNVPEKTQPQKEQPVRNAPERTQPQKEQPVRNVPERTQPQKEQPVRNVPERTQPQKEQPVRNVPERTQPQKEQPVRNAPARTQPQQQKNPPPRKKNGNG